MRRHVRATCPACHGEGSTTTTMRVATRHGETVKIVAVKCGQCNGKGVIKRKAQQ